MNRQSVFIGFDPREADAFAVARHSINRHLILPIPVRGLVLDELRAQGLYHRPTSRRDGRLWDDISDAPMATEFSNSRFLVPKLARSGWALFIDCDVLVRTDLQRLFTLADPDKAVMVVKHDHQPTERTKMDSQVQTRYGRKNWSSVCLWNVQHPANRPIIETDIANTLPGRDLHRFCWLEDDQIGEIHCRWNWLVGHSDPAVDPAIVHFTDGIPTMPGYEDCAYADEWRAEIGRWAA